MMKRGVVIMKRGVGVLIMQLRALLLHLSSVCSYLACAPVFSSSQKIGAMEMQRCSDAAHAKVESSRDRAPFRESCRAKDLFV